MNDPRVQAMLERSRHNNLSTFIISQEYYELPKRTIPASGNIYHISEANNFRGVQNLYQNESSMDLTLNEFKYLLVLVGIKKYQPITLDMTKDKYTGRYRLGLISLFVPDSFPFKLTE